MRTAGRAVAGLLFAVAALVLTGPIALAQARTTYLYTLANFGGPLRLEGAHVTVDQDTDETFVIYQSLVRIFNPSGMEVFSFGDDLNVGQILDLAVDRNGDILLLSFKDEHSIVTRCNFRGVPMGSLEIKNLPTGMTFKASRMVRRKDALYFASLPTSTVVITGLDGAVRSTVDLRQAVRPETPIEDRDSVGFTVDEEGSIYLTMPSIFQVVKRTPDGKVVSFGTSGSAPGKFGVLGGIAVDRHGNLLIADKLKCTLIAFDKELNLIGEFGARGSRPEDLVVPDDLAVDNRDRLYVAQWRQRGVSVFALALR